MSHNSYNLLHLYCHIKIQYPGSGLVSGGNTYCDLLQELTLNVCAQYSCASTCNGSGLAFHCLQYSPITASASVVDLNPED